MFITSACRLSLVLVLGITACTSKDQGEAVSAASVRITSLTSITGTVNESPFEGKISATIDTDGGGSSTCEFAKLPPGYQPSTLYTHT
jgi:hypothetical protein